MVIDAYDADTEDVHADHLEAKEWVVQDEQIVLVTETTAVGERLWVWETDSYLPICNVEAAQADDAVILGDIVADVPNKTVGIYLYETTNDE